jgi:ABC-type antimicrobial peptide transport system permease subunit
MSDIMSHMQFAEEALGYYPVTIEAMILQDFKLANLSVTFLHLVFNLVVVLMFTISVLLIYSLLMLSVESKSFDLGVMRMVGLSKGNVMLLVVMQSFTFVLPAIIAGFSVSLVLLKAMQIYSEQVLYMDFESVPSISSVMQALFLSIAIPLMSSILPIRIVL